MTAEKQVFLAAATTFAITILSLTMYDRVIPRGERMRRDLLLSLALGSAAGAGFVLALIQRVT